MITTDRTQSRSTAPAPVARQAPAGSAAAATGDRPAEATWRALGIAVHLIVSAGTRLEPARRAVADVLADVDATYSRFRPDSEISLLHATPDREVPVSPLLARAIEVALRAARLTGGACDPTLGRSLRLLGYDADFARLRDPGRDDAGDGPPAGRTRPPSLRFASVAGWEAIRLDPAAGRVRIPAGVELDLGATGKGLAADLAAEAALAAMGGGGVLVSLGGDIAVAGTPPTGGWRILVAEDSAAASDGPGDVIRISNGGLATSSTTLRRWTRGGVARHHLLDPDTGLPVDGPWRTATVAASSAADANAASTAAIVMGESAPAWLAATALPARLVAHDGQVVRVGGWPAPLED